MTRQRRRRLIRVRRKGAGVALVAAISFVAGMTDAIGLAMSGDFVSFMTGNTTRAAVSMQSSDFSHATRLLLAIVVFVAGNAGGIILAQISKRRLFTVLCSVGLLLAIAAFLQMQDNGVWPFYVVVFAMGMINAAVENVEGLPIGLTYVTGALSRFGRGLGRLVLGDRNLDWTIQLVPWIGMISGALCGAMLAASHSSSALVVVSLLVVSIAVASTLMPRSVGRRYNGARPN